jgi:hypothetical protein
MPDRRRRMRISRQPSPVQIIIDKKQPENAEYFKTLGSMVNYARCTCKIKSRISMTKAAFNRKNNILRNET